jgi:L-erythro-3,5-diaminohexanoate dehydrogenase
VTSPAVGSPAGDHRVLEPPGATTATARRLDALADLWDGEVRVDLTAAVLDEGDLARWLDRLGGDTTTLAAALVETVAERGALDDEPGEGTLLGHVAAVGRAHPWPAEVGVPVAIPLPARAVPAFAVPGPWAGTTPVIPLRGHAIAPAGVPTVLTDGATATAARWLAQHADVPDAVDAAVDGGPGPRAGQPVLVLAADTPPGAIAVAHLADRGASVCAVVEGLSGARVAEGLGASEVLVADLADAVGSAAVVAADGPGPVDLVVLAAPAGAALSARLARRVLVLGDERAAGVVARDAVTSARPVDVLLHRRPGAGRGIRVRELVASSNVLADVLRWRSGHPIPSVSGHEPPPWERT